MAAQKGRNILIKISNGLSPGTFTTIAGIRSKTITINNEAVDITTADDAPWRKLLANTGARTISVSGAGVFQDDAAVNEIEDLSMSGGIEEFQLIFENGDMFQGLFQPVSFEYSGEHTSEMTFSVTLESADMINFSRA